MNEVKAVKLAVLAASCGVLAGLHGMSAALHGMLATQDTLGNSRELEGCLGRGGVGTRHEIFFL